MESVVGDGTCLDGVRVSRLPGVERVPAISALLLYPPETEPRKRRGVDGPAVTGTALRLVDALRLIVFVCEGRVERKKEVTYACLRL